MQKNEAMATRCISLYSKSNKKREQDLVINLMDNNTRKVVKTHKSSSWDVARRRGSKLVMSKDGEGKYVRIYDDRDHSKVVFITRERVLRSRRKMEEAAGE